MKIIIKGRLEITLAKTFTEFINYFYRVFTNGSQTLTPARLVLI